MSNENNDAIFVNLQYVKSVVRTSPSMPDAALCATEFIVFDKGISIFV